MFLTSSDIPTKKMILQKLLDGEIDLKTDKSESENQKTVQWIKEEFLNKQVTEHLPETT